MESAQQNLHKDVQALQIKHVNEVLLTGVGVDNQQQRNHTEGAQRVGEQVQRLSHRAHASRSLQTM